MRQRSQLRYAVLGVMGLVLALSSCSKPDKNGGDISGQLTNKYCNLPSAVNYNWGFPGIEDNSTCFFARDYFIGNWNFVDTVLLEDSTFIEAKVYNFQFEAQDGDTSHTKMNMKGWCGSSNILLAVNRYYIANSDTTNNVEGWQIVCNGTDSVKVDLSRNMIDTNKVDIHIRQFRNDTLFHHRGQAVKN